VLMESGGFIKIHRIMMKWEWYQNPNMVQILLHFILKANHKEKKWQGVVIKRGQFISGRKAISADLKMSQQSVRTCIGRLIKCGELTSKTTNKFTLYTLSKWDQYQLQDYEPTNKLTNEQPATNQQLTTNKKDKNDKNEKEIDISVKIIMDLYRFNKPGANGTTPAKVKIAKILESGKYTEANLVLAVERHAKEANIGGVSMKNPDTFFGVKKHYIDFIESWQEPREPEIEKNKRNP